MKIIVAGWRAAQRTRDSVTIAEGLKRAEEWVRHDHPGVDPELNPITLVHGGNPLGGVDEIAAEIADGWGWNVDNREHERRELRPGTGTGNYLQMYRDGAYLAVLFPGLNDTDAMDAMRWAIRYGIPFIGFPLTGGKR